MSRVVLRREDWLGIIGPMTSRLCFKLFTDSSLITYLGVYSIPVVFCFACSSGILMTLSGSFFDDSLIRVDSVSLLSFCFKDKSSELRAYLLSWLLFLVESLAVLGAFSKFTSPNGFEFLTGDMPLTSKVGFFFPKLMMLLVLLDSICFYGLFEGLDASYYCGLLKGL